MAKIKKRNHWIPRFYLSYFALPETRGTPSPNVWSFSKTSGDPFQVSVANVGLKNYLYAPENCNHERSQEFEDFLADFESKISKIWITLGNVEAKFGNVHIKKILSYFIATMYLRNIKRLDEIRELHNEILMELEKLPKDINGNPNVCAATIGEETFELNRESYFEFKYPSYDHEHEMFVDSIKTNTSEIASSLIKKKWTILANSESRFITTDNPISCLDSESVRCGILKDDVKVYFPLSPKYLLCIHDDQRMLDNRYYTVSKPELFNYISWSNAYMYMFSPRDIDEVLFEMKWIFDSIEIETAKIEK